MNEIGLSDFCLLHLLMARPDPEVDVAFVLMDRRRRGYIDLDDFKVRDDDGGRESVKGEREGRAQEGEGERGRKS